MKAETITLSPEGGTQSTVFAANYNEGGVWIQLETNTHLTFGSQVVAAYEAVACEKAAAILAKHAAACRVLAKMDPLP